MQVFHHTRESTLTPKVWRKVAIATYTYTKVIAGDNHRIRGRDCRPDVEYSATSLEQCPKEEGRGRERRDYNDGKGRHRRDGIDVVETVRERMVMGGDTTKVR